eukprot:5152254-Pyramimonas_sp.AAC.1
MSGVTIRRELGTVWVGGRKVDPRHQIWSWDHMSLKFCMLRGFTATLDGRHLSRPCGPAVAGAARSKKGQCNL